jgi:F0F1-type ATP synthase assembly protein I
MTKDKFKQNQPILAKKLNWQLGLKFGLELSGWLIGPIVVALFVGQWLDSQFNSKPIAFLALITIAFIITVKGILSQTKKIINEGKKNLSWPQQNVKVKENRNEVKNDR